MEDNEIGTLSITEDLQNKLEAKPASRYVKQDYDGNDYLPGWYMIAQANRIFGPASWSYTTVTVPERCDEGQTSKGRPYVAYVTVVRVTVHFQAMDANGALVESTVEREDIGQSKQIGDGRFGSAAKGSITDGLKRCLRTFGNAFGNHLYSDGGQGVVDRSRQQQPQQGNPRSGGPRSGSPPHSSGPRRKTGYGTVLASQLEEIRRLASENNWDERKMPDWINSKGIGNGITELSDLSEQSAASFIDVLKRHTA